jgi:hypothetical protein
MTSWVDVVLVDANLATVPVPVQSRILTEVRDTLSADGTGVRYDLLSKYLAAHSGLVYLRSAAGGLSGGVSGPVSSESADGVSRTYGVSVGGGATDAGRAALDSTPWGREFLRLLQMLPSRLPVAS